MSFWALPPEINSARMYAGPGASPLLAAASAWTALSTGLTDTAAAYSSAISGLQTAWMGPSAIAMSQAAQRYQAWLTTTALQAATTAQQASAAAASYEAAFAATVPPELVAANRALLAQLVATNLLGQNTPAIAAAEAQYAEMWAQDVAAMAGYQTASQQAMALPAFAPAPAIANAGVQPLAAASTPGIVQQLLGLLTDPTTLLGQANVYTQDFVQSGAWFDVPLATLGLFSSMWAMSSPNTPFAQALNQVGTHAAANMPPPMPTRLESPALNVTASARNAVNLGRLRVCPDWARPIPGTMPAPTPGTVAPLNEPMPVPLPMPMARGGTPPKQDKPPPEYGATPSVMPRHPYGG